MRVLWGRTFVFILTFFYLAFICHQNWSWRNRIRGLKRDFQTLVDLTGGKETRNHLGLNVSFTSPVEDSNGPPSEVIIIINTTPDEVVERDVIRTTWLQWSNRYPVKVFFLLGDVSRSDDLRLEQSLHNDLILIPNFKEGYYRLTIKTLLMLQWYTKTYATNHQLRQPRFLVKADSDIFLNIPLLMATLFSEEARKFYDRNGYYVGGRLFVEPPINTDPNSKFYITSNLWLRPGSNHSYYPNYFNGPCYIMSTNVLEEVYKAALEHPIFPMEDVFVTGLVIREAPNMTKVMDLTHLTHTIQKGRYRGEVALYKDKLMAHPVDSPELMRIIYSSVRA